MDMSFIQIVAAIVMAGAALALFITFRRHTAAASERRMRSMLEQVGLDPEIASSADAETIVKQVRQRCRSCTTESVCERWLLGDEAGENVFCPNASVFDALKREINAIG